MMRVIRVMQAFLYRDALMATSYRLAFVMQVASLGLSVVSLYFMSRLVGARPEIDQYGGYLPFAVVGMAMAGFLTTGFSSLSGAIRSEQMMGTLESVLMTPARLPWIVIASSLWSFIWAILTAAATLGAAWLFFGIEFRGNLLMAAALVALTTLTFSCLGILSASFIMVFKRGDPLAFLTGSLSYLLGGVFYPISILPVWMQKLSNLLPIKHGLEGLRDVLLVGRPAAEVVPQLLILLLFCAIGLPLSLLCFRWAVSIAQREGSLLHY